MFDNIASFLRNSSIAATAYLCICLLLLALRFVMMLFNVLELSERGLGAVLYTASSLLLCFLVGRLCLKKTYSIALEALALLPLGIIIATLLHISFGNPGSYGSILAIPIYVLCEHVSVIFSMQLKHTYLLMSALAPLLMWTGMMSKVLTSR